MKDNKQEKRALIFPCENIEEICEQINFLLADNDDWKVTEVDIMQHEDGSYTGVINYIELDIKLDD